MKFKDYIAYMKTQRDEDPLYVFDDKVRETVLSFILDFIHVSDRVVVVPKLCGENI